MGVLLFLLVVTIVVIVHEFGHYIACRAFKVTVAEFAVGFGPKIASFNAFGTEWSLRAIPLGGYIRPICLERITLAKQAIVALAGPLGNIIPMLVAAFFYDMLWGAIVILAMMYVITIKVMFGLIASPFVWLATLGQTSVTIGGAESVTKSVIGPIAISNGAGAALTEYSFGMVFLAILLMLNISVAIFNLLPIPLLDGGRIVSCGIEKVFGTAKTKTFRKNANYVGLWILLALFTFVMGRELIQWIF